MRASFAAALLLLMISGSAVQAQPTIGLSWDECSTLPDQVPFKSSPCTTNEGDQQVVITYTSAATQTVQRCLVEIRVVNSSNAPLPNWWRLQRAGGCRTAISTRLNFGDPPLEDGLCGNPWAGRDSVVLYTFYNSSQDYLAIILDIQFPTVVELAANVKYAIGAVQISNVQTVSDGACSGCSEIVGILLNGTDLQDASGAWVRANSYGSLQWQW